MSFRGKQWRFEAPVLWRRGNSDNQDVQSRRREVCFLRCILIVVFLLLDLISLVAISMIVIRWSLIAGRIPGRTAEEIEKYWNSRYSTSEWRFIWRKNQNQKGGNLWSSLPLYIKQVILGVMQSIEKSYGYRRSHFIFMCL